MVEGWEMKSFDVFMNEHQTSWRKSNISDKRHGYQNGHQRPWILPKHLWEEGLWPQLRTDSSDKNIIVKDYLKKWKVQRHTGTHNLKSSWIQCANVYFPFRRDPDLLLGFLKEKVSSDIISVDSIDLEYALDPPLDPHTLLGEPKGKRGSGQTSPDLAINVSTKTGKGLLLIENKLTEHSFYSCSGRKKDYGIPDSSVCKDFAFIQNDLSNNCYQMTDAWAQDGRFKRKYWKFLEDNLTIFGKNLKMCPATTAGYQLFRQQALAEAIAESGKYNLVVSCVAYDEKNMTLKRCLRYSTGIKDFTEHWGEIFDGQAGFKTFTHQQWVRYVSEHGSREWSGWLKYVKRRYDF